MVARIPQAQPRPQVFLPVDEAFDPFDEGLGESPHPHVLSPVEIQRDLIGLIYDLLSVVQKQDCTLALYELRLQRLERFARAAEGGKP
jgi:hypothetical protein